MRWQIVVAFFFAVCLATTAAASRPVRIAAKFGGECEGTSFQPSSRLASLIRSIKQREPQRCDWKFCEGVFAYDLNGDQGREYFVRLACGATGNCLWGIFSDRPARLRGTFTAWFFYIHRRSASWNALTTYTREGYDEGVITTLHNQRGRYIQTSERRDHGYNGNLPPFLKRMGVPKCS